MCREIRVLLTISFFVLCIYNSDEIDLLPNYIEENQGYNKPNVKILFGNFTCCCIPNHYIEAQILNVYNKIKYINSCENIDYLTMTPCVCSMTFNESTDSEKLQLKTCLNHSTIYISVGVATFILLLTQILCLLLIRKKRTGLLVERLSERQRNHNSISGKSYAENHELKLHNKDMNAAQGDPVKRDRLIVKERESSNIYHSLDNLHFAPQEPSSQRTHKRGPLPLPHEDDSFNSKAGPASSTWKLAPQMQSPLQKTERGKMIVAAELNTLFNKRRMPDDKSNTYQTDQIHGEEMEFMQKSNSVPEMVPAVKPKPAFPLRRNLEGMSQIPPNFSPLLKSKTNAVPIFKPRAASPQQTNVPALQPPSEYEDDDEWTYEQLPHIPIYNI